jgi:uncharacterized delta-60 repeat protein
VFGRTYRSTLVGFVAVGVAAAAGMSPVPAWGADGGLDPSFGTDGTALYDFETADNETISQAFSEAVLPNGKIVVAGTNGSDMLAAQLTSSGALDPTFGTGGADEFSVQVQGAALSLVRSVLVEPNGDLLLVGDADSAPSYPAIIRLLPDGSVDPSFGNDGLVTLSAMDVQAAALAPDGNIVLAGTGSVYSPSCLMLTQVTTSGAVDTSFGNDGTVCDQTDTQLPGNEQSAASAVAVQSNGDIDVLANNVADTGVGETYEGFVAQFTAAGALSPSFGDSGIAALAIPGVDGPRGEGLALQPDGDLVAVGEGTNDSLQNTVDTLRLLPSGRPDPSFGSGGVVVISGGDDPATDEAGDAVAVRPDGNIVVSASAEPYGRGPTDVWLLTSAGQPDASFASDGKAALTGDLTTDQVQPDGGVLLAGAAPAGKTDFDLAVTRLLGPSDSSPPGGSTPIGPPSPAPPDPTSPASPTGTSAGSGGGSTVSTGAPTSGSAPIVVPVQHLQPPVTKLTLRCPPNAPVGAPQMGLCTVSFVSNVVGEATDVILDGRRTVARSRQHVRHGRNRLSLTSHRALRAGRYRLRLTLREPGGHTAVFTTQRRLD